MWDGDALIYSVSIQHNWFHLADSQVWTYYTDSLAALDIMPWHEQNYFLFKLTILKYSFLIANWISLMFFLCSEENTTKSE